MQTILGSGGAVGTELAKSLDKYTGDIRLVSRNPGKAGPGTETVSADLTNREDTSRAVEGSSVAYLTAGIPYDTRVWKQNWPAIMRNVIDACMLHDTKLVFFDNIYMYDPDYLDGMDEHTPVNPPSEKGKVRAQIAEMLLSEVQAGNLTALIARSADYYGPSVRGTSILTETVLNNLANGKKALWLGSAAYKHSFTFTPDAGRATALLGNTPDAYNQVWHLPTATPPPDGKGWTELIARTMKVEPKYRTVPKFLVRTAGLFMPVMRETVEMIYQYERDYVFNSDKFEERFDFGPTPYKEGIRQIVEEDY